MLENESIYGKCNARIIVFRQTLNRLDHKKLFLIDSLGALLSAIMLGVVLVQFESTFGMPQTELLILSIIAGLFFVYSFLCYLSKLEKWKPYMKFIGVVNLLYCCLTLGFIFFLYQELKVLGLVYFVGEIIAVTILATIELKTASKMVDKK